MTKSELLAWLNEGRPNPISARQLSDWIDERLIGRAIAKGQGRGRSPIWHLPEGSCERAKAILDLKDRGAVRTSQLRLGLWLECYEIPTKDLKSSIQVEFGRSLSRLRRSLPLPKELKVIRKYSMPDIIKAYSKLGKLDDSFVGSDFEFDHLSILQIASASYWGDAQRIDAPDESLCIFYLFSGLFGRIDEIENSAEEILVQVTIVDINDARTMFNLMKSSILLTTMLCGDRVQNLAAIEGVVQAFFSVEWMPLLFGMCLHLTVRGRLARTGRNALS